MYQLQKIPFGSFEKYQIWNEKSGNSFSFVPGHGACLLDLKIGGHSIIEGFDTVPELISNRWMKNALLVPFPNRLKLGAYDWDDKFYEFFLNDPVTQNALHGFVMDKKMELTQKGLTQEHAIVSCAYEYDGGLEGYPFPFTLEVTYLIKEPNSFEVKMSFQNRGTTAIPVGLGWHPYFRLEDTIDKTRLQLPACKMIGVDEFMIPTGKSYKYTEFENLKSLGATILDNCFKLEGDAGRAEILLQTDTRSLRYWQDTGEGKFNYFQIFTHPDRTSVAIEPMTCNVDAFNNGDGLVVLEAGNVLEVGCGVELELS